MNSRDLAFHALQKVELEDSFADLAIPSNLAPQVRNDVRTIVFGVLRWRSRLDALVVHLSGRPIAKIDQPLLQILRISLAERYFLDTPPHAAVNEAVTLASRRYPRGKGFVNAVLRKTGTADLAALEQQARPTPAMRLGHPEWLLERWTQRFGAERASAIAAANQELSRPDVFVNTSRTTLEEIEQRLRESDVATERSDFVPGMLRLRGASDEVQRCVEEGLLYPMDEGSAAIATLIPRECRTVLDLAAAPGGKSLFMRMRGQEVTSHDISLRRLQPLLDSAMRMFGSLPRVMVGDGTRPAFLQNFSAVLIDAPCSATGTIRRNPEIKWRLSPEQLAEFQKVQVELLRAALSVTRDFAVYSTCSLELEENDAVVAQVLSNTDEFERIDLATVADGPLREWVEEGVLRLTPESGADGFTAFGFRRR